MGIEIYLFGTSSGGMCEIMEAVKKTVMKSTDAVYRYVYRDRTHCIHTGIMNDIWIPIENKIGIQHDRECIRGGWFLGLFEKLI